MSLAAGGSGGSAGGPDPGELARELAAFPPALRALVDAELAAGNSILELGHTHPAPPAGAYVKLARKVTSRARASGDGLDFYDRNGSSYSGEFTDARRFHFVLEPPNPPPPEPDMDAIRRAFTPRPDPLVQLAERRADGAEPAPTGAVTDLETATGRHHELCFVDRRPPHLVQFALERELMVLFTPDLTDGVLRFRARAEVVGAPYDFELSFVAALPNRNWYRFTMDVSWAEQAATHHDYFRKTSASWVSFWTRELTPAAPPRPDEGRGDRYRELAEAALEAEAHLDSVEAIQAAIVAGVRQGGRYATAHKEGGSNITWRGDCFVRSDYGDYPGTTTYPDAAAFLTMLRHFCFYDVTRNAGKQTLFEAAIWKLILRRMMPR